MVLLSHLPRDGAVGRALQGDAAEWTVEHELLATLADIGNVGNWLFLKAHADKPRKVGDAPEPIPRPKGLHRPAHEPTRQRRRHMTHAEMAELFGLPLRADHQDEEVVDGD